MAPASRCGGRGTWKHPAGSREGRVVHIDGAPVVPGLEEVVALRFIFVDVGKLLDEFPQFGSRHGEDGEKRVEKLRGGDVRSAESRDAVTE